MRCASAVDSPEVQRQLVLRISTILFRDARSEPGVGFVTSRNQ
jgi:hypothetical protein